MKINQSLSSFSSTISTLVWFGLLLSFIGFIMVSTHQGYDFDLGFVTSGFGIIYLGSGMIGLAIFGAFLRSTAKAVIEGLGGNIVSTKLEMAAAEQLAAVKSTDDL